MRRVALHLHDINSGTPKPLYVMNITDVDDKIIRRSQEIANKVADEDDEDEEEDEVDADPMALARKYEKEFWQDMDHLNVLRPDVICRVSEHVESTIVPYIQQILDGGMAYVLPENDLQNEGSVYFDVRAFEERSNGLTKYGKLAPDVASTDFFSWENPDNNDNDGEHACQPIKKRDPRDFALWKYRPRHSNSTTQALEPESVSYPSPWGSGRPGWHVECSAMIERLSRDFSSTHQFLVHAGGVDLKFPHHSNEIAQAEAFSIASGDEVDKEWIPHWMHTGHLYVKGRKMSKSLKNFVTIREMLGIANGTKSTFYDESDWISPADDFRLWCLGLSGSYRGPATYSKDRMEEARVIRDKWLLFLMEGQRLLDDQLGKIQSIRMWHPKDNELFLMVTKSSISCYNALTGHASADGDKGSFDLDGASFVKDITHIADEGLKYLEHAKANHKLCPAEPLKFTLSTMRELLSLVGFTDKTCTAGLKMAASRRHHGFFKTKKEIELIDAIVGFRAAVRFYAIDGIRNKDGISAAKDILRLCDEVRDEVLPDLEVKILDGKSDAEDEESFGGWISCPPRDGSTEGY